MTDTLTLNLADGSVAFACSLETAQTLKSELQTLWASLKTIAASANTAEGDTPTKPSPQPTLEYRQVGDVFLEVFCNSQFLIPNSQFPILLNNILKND